MSAKLYHAADLAYWYELGVRHERERAAGARAELDTSWTRSGTEVSASHHAERMRLFAEAAERFHERELGRPYAPFVGVGV